MSARLTIDTPTGPLTLTEEAGALTQVTWGGGGDDDTVLLRAAAGQLTAYFDGKRTEFDLPLKLSGSATQRGVCTAIAAIPFGETRTYGEIARDLGLPAQAVGQGCGANPLPIVIPCHRVLGAHGLGGFSGGAGVETKVWLLRHEGAGGFLI
ncbi:methylated-DNA--[protein]-cysteine S-methyltransferase [Lutimaribacter sp. EGI FJ00015]|uniref:Methylated-DNA--[protein]-cysteine S-methyltransferase n=1 Tax=Lutimaribacter degradans TaxID=2945989 RepID=A0ACC5ZS09_9RHOB|nr:methylated-DNA--[protein]-cysteine S-methyltransferase [Lutimaribacter sp. EGI FJ00013]MCM2560571.1 methylated-DNA--[protein]-cysteine S-methyltransferase [Lutimaribacter sp. EGI FJ00013]MCO0612486.1 methylated-DNA--[protein]-cysteine S-methyltransferase [Lutimaribacter sp. EGI FJ00015]MCO0634395.1 methylated-DNA--[protein]-cysteine S-methyltransferase [Lutimaribacter sp. EGI FJ00014]